MPVLIILEEIGRQADLQADADFARELAAAPFLETIVKAKDLTVVGFIIAIIAIIIVPLPSALLDFFLTISIAISVLIILISLYIPKPTDLTTFPK